MTQLISATPARPRWRAALATFALVGALFAAGGAASASADVVGTGPGTVSGTVTSTGGQPIPGAFVTISQSSGQGTSFSASAAADSLGQFEFTGLELGSYSLEAITMGSPATWQDVSLTAESPSAAVTLVIASYSTGTGTISGHVTVDGVPLAGFEVSLTNQTTFQNPSMLTDANGFFNFTGLSNATWVVGGSSGQNYQPLAPAYVVISDASNSAVVDLPYLTWPVGTASIHGVVTDSATGEPLAGVSLSAYSQDAPNQSDVVTDENGAYSFDLLPAGTYYLSVWASGYLPVFVENLPVASGASVVRNLAAVAANSTISGHVTGPDGSSAAGVYVSAYSTGQSGSAAGGQTDADGNYTLFGLGAIQYTVSVGGPGTTFEGQQKLVTPVANGDTTVNFVLAPRTTATLSGYVLGPDGEWSNSPVCVTLYSSKSKKPLGNQATYGPDFGDGTFYFDSLKPGSYTVEFRDCDSDPKTKFDKVFLGGAKDYKDATFVTLAAGVDSYDNSITLTLRK